jgi:hypothetical protein
MRIPAVEARSAIAVSRWAANTVSTEEFAWRPFNALSGLPLMRVVLFWPDQPDYRLPLLKYKPALRSIEYRRRNRLGDPARAVAAEHFLDGHDARQTLVPLFDRGMGVARRK